MAGVGSAAKATAKGAKGAASAAAKTADTTKAVFSFDATKILWILASSIGLLPFAFMAFIALIVILAIISILGSQSSTYNPDPSASGLPANAQNIIDQYGGDGTGKFKSSAVPDQDLVDIIKKAAKKCDLLTPIILSAQIEYASNWDATKTGDDGRKGLSQMTTAEFEKYGEDDDDNGKISQLDAADDIYAHARYFCFLATEVQKLIDKKAVLGDQLSLTLMAWNTSLTNVEAYGGMVYIDVASYPFQLRQHFAKYTGEGEETDDDSTDTTSTGSGMLTEATFNEFFSGKSSFYTYAGFTKAMAKYPEFATTGSDDTKKREMASFLANLYHESGGLVYTEELNQSVWGNYCDSSQSYGCPAGQTAYHGRGPIQLSWNYNYKAAGDALGVDLLNDPDLVKNDETVAWETALWFWMTQPGSTSAHSAVVGNLGFGSTIRIINSIECNNGHPDQVADRIAAYKRITKILGIEPEDDAALTC
ncbi:glycoside hydrolase family 19 protein [Actinoplanes sp. NPDC051851]|uniref:glycoside hydrolase family 19 protein n=1 Tax=Actinoplanes sp. NPDC051851 TaxID=3154753 RepID=UPI003443BF0E